MSLVSLVIQEETEVKRLVRKRKSAHLGKAAMVISITDLTVDLLKAVVSSTTKAVFTECRCSLF